jgi:hypothetical protein
MRRDGDASGRPRRRGRARLHWVQVDGDGSADVTARWQRRRRRRPWFWLGSCKLRSPPAPAWSRDAIQSRCGGTERMDEEEMVAFVLCTVWPSWPVDSCWAMGRGLLAGGGVAWRGADGCLCLGGGRGGGRRRVFLAHVLCLALDATVESSGHSIWERYLKPEGMRRAAEGKRGAAKAVCRYGILKR